MSSYVVQRAYIPNASEYARKLGVSRQYLSKVVHNEKMYKGNRILEEYKALKDNDTARMAE